MNPGKRIQVPYDRMIEVWCSRSTDLSAEPIDPSTDPVEPITLTETLAISEPLRNSGTGGVEFSALLMDEDGLTFANGVVFPPGIMRRMAASLFNDTLMVDVNLIPLPPHSELGPTIEQIQ
jgi:hypothetical protein